MLQPQISCFLLCAALNKLLASSFWESPLKINQIYIIYNIYIYIGIACVFCPEIRDHRGGQGLRKGETQMSIIGLRYAKIRNDEQTSADGMNHAENSIYIYDKNIFNII